MSNPNGTPENLVHGKDTQFKSGEQAAIYGSKGGKASAKAKKRRKALKEALEIGLESALNGSVAESMSDIDFAEAMQSDKISMLEKIAVSMIAEAVQGNVRAAEFIRDTIGEKPVEKLDVTQNVEQVEKDITAKIEEWRNSDTD